MLHWDFMDTIEISQISAYSFRYAAGFSLLRNSLELIIRGAFYNMIADPHYLDDCSVVDKPRKISNQSVTFREKLIEIASEASFGPDDWRVKSSLLLFVISHIQMDSAYWKVVPNIFEMLNDLKRWNILEPFHKSVIYDIYRVCSLSTHGAPFFTDQGRRLPYDDVELFTPPKFIEEEFDQYVINLNQIVEISMCVTLNLLRLDLSRETQIQQVKSLRAELDKYWIGERFSELCNRIMNQQ